MLAEASLVDLSLEEYMGHLAAIECGQFGDIKHSSFLSFFSLFFFFLFLSFFFNLYESSNTSVFLSFFLSSFFLFFFFLATCMKLATLCSLAEQDGQWLVPSLSASDI
jgi:hypothetical protein